MPVIPDVVMDVKILETLGVGNSALGVEQREERKKMA